MTTVPPPEVDEAAIVAIITRTKNRPLLLERAMRSVLDQSYTDLEHVIVNDGGDAHAVDAVAHRLRDAYSGRLRVLHRRESCGMEAASNVGLAQSSSRYVTFLDDDDTWDPRFLASTIAFLEGARPPSVRGVVTQSVRVYERIDGDVVRELRRRPHNPWLRDVTLFRMAAQNSFANNAFVYERAVFDEIGRYREDLPVLGDWEFNLRFLAKFDIGVIPHALSHYHHREKGGATAYANTVVEAVPVHNLHEAILRNEWLRADLGTGRVGLGLVAAEARALLELERTLGSAWRLLAQQPAERVRDWTQRIMRRR